MATEITISGIEQQVLKGRYYTPESDGVRKVIHPETSVEFVIDKTGKTLDKILTENATAANSYTDAKVAALVDSAPETLDTLKEIADAIQENESTVDAINAAIANKADKTAVEAINGRLTTAEGTLATKADQSAVNTISGKVTTLEETVANMATSEDIEGLESRVSAVEGAVATKAESSTVDAINGRLTTAEGTLATKADKSTVDALPTVVVGEEAVGDSGIKTNDIYIQLV